MFLLGYVVIQCTCDLLE